jgi:hypothetical protein
LVGLTGRGGIEWVGPTLERRNRVGRTNRERRNRVGSTNVEEEE